MKKSNKEDAVSPVIGVMLMLVVTIVIAAVVSTFASGMGADVEAAPTAVLDVKVTTGDAGSYVTLKHNSGEELPAAYLSVKVQDESGAVLYSKTTWTDMEDNAFNNLLTPGTTIKSAVETTNKPDAGEYVTVLVLYDGKHVLVSKDVMAQ